MHRLINWFYCLNLQTVNKIMVCFTIAAVVFIAALGRKKLFGKFLAVILAAWAAAVLTATLLRSGQNMPYRAFGGLLASYHAALTGGNPEILRSNYMNILLFYPAGVLAQGLCVSAGTKRKILLALLLFSGSIEILQFLLKLGYAECDDVLHNGVGLLLGYWVTGLLVWMLRAVFCRNRKKSPENADQ